MSHKFGQPILTWLLVAGSCLLGCGTQKEPGPAAVPSCGRSDLDSAGIVIDFDKELVVRSLDVVEDPCRTTWNNTCSPDIQGHWTFGYLMEQMAGEMPISQFIGQWIGTWAEEQMVSGKTVAARKNAQLIVSSAWAKAGYPSHSAPFRLLAIVNRVDLAGSTYGASPSEGEGRFVFGFVDPNSSDLRAASPLEGAVIFEYKLPLPATRSNPFDWAAEWHKLGSLEGEAYRLQLQKITDGFVRRGTDSQGPNLGSSIKTVRTNESALSGSEPEYAGWEMRSYSLRGFAGSPCAPPSTTCTLQLSRLTNTPDATLNASTVLRDFVYANSEKILTQTFVMADSTKINGVPVETAGSIFLTSMPASVDWRFAPISGRTEDYYDLRHYFSFGTCNGCHYSETGTSTLHISPRKTGETAALSDFLSLVDLKNPAVYKVKDVGVSPVAIFRFFNEPRRRACELVRLLLKSELRFARLNNSVRM